MFVGITVYLCITVAELVAQMCCVFVELFLHVSLDGTTGVMVTRFTKPLRPECITILTDSRTLISFQNGNTHARFCYSRYNAGKYGTKIIP